MISNGSNRAIDNYFVKNFVQKWTLQFYLPRFTVLVQNQSRGFCNSVAPLCPKISTIWGPPVYGKYTYPISSYKTHGYYFFISYLFKGHSTKIRQSSMGRWDKRLIDQVSDVPSIIIFS
jgi:hypothetical protein